MYKEQSMQDLFDNSVDSFKKSESTSKPEIIEHDKTSEKQNQESRKSAWRKSSLVL